MSGTGNIKSAVKFLIVFGVFVALAVGGIIALWLWTWKDGFM